MKKRDILKEPTLKLALTSQLLCGEHQFEMPPLPKIILTRYNVKEMRRQYQEHSGSYYGEAFSQRDSGGIHEEEFLYKASDGFQQIEVAMCLRDSKKLNLFNARPPFDTHQLNSNEKKAQVCLFTVLTNYEFQVSTPKAIPNDQRSENGQSSDGGRSLRNVQLVVKDFSVHSLHERLNADILHPPEQEELPYLQKDHEIITYQYYLSHCELKKKALRMNIQMPELRLGEPLSAEESMLERGIEPVYTENEQLQKLGFSLQGAPQIQQPIAIKVEQQENQESDVDIVQTESEDLDNEDSAHSGREQALMNKKIHQRIKQLLGASFNKVKTEEHHQRSKSEGGQGQIKSGRGKWHYASDQKYGFNVSYSNGDTIISMGQVFIIQTPKASISSKYRGYPMPVIEPTKQSLIVDNDLDLGGARIPKFRTTDSRSDSYQVSLSCNQISRSYHSSGMASGDYPEEVKLSSDNVQATTDSYLAMGPVFKVYTYLTREEAERQRSLVIQDRLKYEEEYLSYQLKQRAVRALKERKAKEEEVQKNYTTFGDVNFNRESNFLQQQLDECKREFDQQQIEYGFKSFDENEESYMSDTNYQQYGLDSLKTPPSIFQNQLQPSGGPKKFSFTHDEPLTDQPNANMEYSEVSLKPEANQKQCSFFVDSTYFGHNRALKKAFKIKNTVMKIFKYGTKDLFRFSNATLLEKFDEQEDQISRLRDEPQVYGNQKRKRMLKYYDRVCKLVKRIHKKNQYVPEVIPSIVQQPALASKCFNRSDILKYLQWFKYQSERTFYSQTKHAKVSINYDVSTYYPVNHVFAMRLLINVERPRQELSQPVFMKEENEEKVKPQIWQGDRRVTLKTEVEKASNPPPSMKKVEVEIPFYQRNFFQVGSTTMSIPQLQSKIAEEQGNVSLILNHTDELSQSDEEEELLKEFCQKAQGNDQVSEGWHKGTHSNNKDGESSSKFFIDGSNQRYSLINQDLAHHFPPQSSQCDFTVQLSDNEEEPPQPF